MAVVIAMTVTAGQACAPRPATIDDLRLGGARVVAVDGHPPTRARSKYVTMIPFVIVNPGEHTFRVALSPKEPEALAETLSVSASVAAGRRYRFQESAQGMDLVEEHEP